MDRGGCEEEKDEPQNNNVDKNLLCYLISGKKEYRDNIKGGNKIEIKILHELVSGLLDLDRIDH